MVLSNRANYQSTHNQNIFIIILQHAVCVKRPSEELKKILGVWIRRCKSEIHVLSEFFTRMLKVLTSIIPLRTSRMSLYSIFNFFNKFLGKITYNVPVPYMTFYQPR
jgi:hypothetical protein